MALLEGGPVRGNSRSHSVVKRMSIGHTICPITSLLLKKQNELRWEMEEIRTKNGKEKEMRI